MFPFLSNSIACNLTINVSHLLSFFIYLLSISFISYSFCIYISFIFIWILLPLFLFFFIYVLSLFYLFFVSFYFFFISFLFLFYLFFLFLFILYMNLSARRICVHNYFLFLLYGGARSRDTTTSVFPYYSYFYP